MCAKMSPTMFLAPACWLLFFLTSVSLISCGGGGGGGDSDFPGQRLFVESAIVSASDGMEGDNFGQAVAIYDKTLLIGADSAAYILALDMSGNWNEVGKLTASDGFPEDGFGRAVALSENVAIIGAENDDDNGNESGSVYVFVKPAGGWIDMTETKKLTASDGEKGDHFGSAVSLAQISTPAVLTSILVVGAKHGGDGSQSNKGSAYIYYDHVFTDAPKTVDWELVAELVNPFGIDYDGFGYSVAIAEEDQIVIGEPYSGFRGAAYVFKESGSWSYPSVITNLTYSSSETNCGYSVAISEDYVLIGCPNNSQFWQLDSRVYAYAPGMTGDWEDKEVILNPPMSAVRNFGGAVAMSGNTAVVGSEPQNEYNGDKAHVFQRHASGRWYEVAMLAPTPTDSNNLYGSSVAISGIIPNNTIVIGSPGGYSNKGLVYILEEQ